MSGWRSMVVGRRLPDFLIIIEYLEKIQLDLKVLFPFFALCLSIECIYCPLQNLGGMDFEMIASFFFFFFFFFLIIHLIQQRFKLLIKSIRLIQ